MDFSGVGPLKSEQRRGRCAGKSAEATAKALRELRVMRKREAGL